MLCADCVVRWVSTATVTRFSWWKGFYKHLEARRWNYLNGSSVRDLRRVSYHILLYELLYVWSAWVRKMRSRLIVCRNALYYLGYRILRRDNGVSNKLWFHLFFISFFTSQTMAEPETVFPKGFSLTVWNKRRWDTTWGPLLCSHFFGLNLDSLGVK